MPHGWCIDWTLDESARRTLSEHALQALLAHPAVASAEVFGSLASAEPDGYPTDSLSDIDIHVRVEGMTDRDFFAQLVDTLAPIGRLIVRSAYIESTGYIGGFLVEGYPPWWHLDVLCESTVHVEEPSVLDEIRHERAFGLWLLALKRFVRAGEFLAYATELIGATDLDVLYEPGQLFQSLLDQWNDSATDPLRYAIGVEVLNHTFGPAR